VCRTQEGINRTEKKEVRDAIHWGDYLLLGPEKSPRCEKETSEGGKVLLTGRRENFLLIGVKGREQLGWLINETFSRTLSKRQFLQRGAGKSSSLKPLPLMGVHRGEGN